MSVYGYLAGSWRKALRPWFWTGTQWKPALGVYIWDGAAWKQGYQSPDLSVVTGDADSGTYPATVTFAYTLSGETDGCTFVLRQNGVYVNTFDATLNPTELIVPDLSPTDPTALELFDVNGFVRSRSVTITHP